MRELTIGEAARQSGVKINTIRFYEDRGLLPAAPRTESGRRLYDRDAVARLSFIRHSRQLGFSLDAIRELLDLRDHPEQSRDEADAIARRRGRRCPGHRVGAVPRGLMPIKPSSSG